MVRRWATGPSSGCLSGQLEQAVEGQEVLAPVLVKQLGQVVQVEKRPGIWPGRPGQSPLPQPSGVLSRLHVPPSGHMWRHF